MRGREKENVVGLYGDNVIGKKTEQLRRSDA